VPAAPQSLRSLTPERLRDDVRLRALAVGLGLIPPRSMHSSEDARVLLEAARAARTVVEIGVYEGASALTLHHTLSPDADLHLIDPFGHHPDALPGGWGATEWATRRVIARAARRAGNGAGPTVHWHVALSHEVAASWSGRAVDLVFIDGDHSEQGCQLDWERWHPLVAPGGAVVFHDARADREGGRGLPGPTTVLARLRAGALPADWVIADEGDRTVALRRMVQSGARP
jgi:predicted O-methyltransferase YrrM